MERKHFIIIISVILLVIVAIITIQERGDFKIVDYNGDPIYYLDHNTKPFKIESENQVTVNGEVYEEGTGIYEVGTYEIVSGVHKKTVVIQDVEKDTSYDFYFIGSEVSAYYSSIFLSRNTNEAYVWYLSSDFFQEDNLKNRSNLKLMHEIGETSLDKVISEATEQVKNVLARDENAYFHLYLSEDYYQIEFSIMASLGLGNHRYEVTYLSDGMTSYENTLQGEDYQHFLTIQNQFLKDLDLIRKTKADANVIDDEKMIFAATNLDNHHFLLPYAELVLGSDEQIKAELNDRIDTRLFSELYGQLSEEEKNQVLSYLNFNVEGLEEWEELDRPYLIVTITNPVSSGYSEEAFANLWDQIIMQYQESHHIVVRMIEEVPASYQTILTERNLTILNREVSLELLELIGIPFQVGGIVQDEYLMLSSDHILFLFGTVADLPYPFAELYQNIVFLNPQI